MNKNLIEDKSSLALAKASLEKERDAIKLENGAQIKQID